MRTVLFAATAAMLALPAQAQSAPPPVPRYNCGMTPEVQAQATAILMQAYRNRDLATMSALNGVIEGYGQGCEMRYNRAMQQWQAEMQRYEMQRRYGN